MIKWLKRLFNKKSSKEVGNVTLEQIIEAAKALSDEDKARLTASLDGGQEQAPGQEGGGDPETTEQGQAQTEEQEATAPAATPPAKDSTQTQAQAPQPAAAPVQAPAPQFDESAIAAIVKTVVAPLEAELATMRATVGEYARSPKPVTEGSPAEAKLKEAEKIYQN